MICNKKQIKKNLSGQNVVIVKVPFTPKPKKYIPPTF